MKYAVQPPVVTYTPSSQMRTPGLLLRSMWGDLKASRELAWQLFRRDISAQYRQTLLGFMWAFVPPIVTSVIFIILQSRNIVNFGETDIPYPIYVIVGTLLWQLFVESVNAPLKSVVAAKPLLVKINFPREALVLSSLYLVMFNFLIKAIILLVVLLAFQIVPGWGSLFAPVAIFMLVLFGITIGLLITPLGVLYTDVSNSLPIVMQLFFFVTPVVYPPPESFPFSLIATANPVSPLLMTARDVITKGVITHVEPFIVVSAITLVGLFIAWLLYRVALPIIIERIGA